MTFKINSLDSRCVYYHRNISICSRPLGNAQFVLWCHGMLHWE